MDKKSEKNEAPTTEPQEGKRGNNSLIIALLLAGSLVLLFYNRGEERDAVSASFFQTELGARECRGSQHRRAESLWDVQDGS